MKTALITGASSGIGAEFARSLAQRGMNLVLVARSENKLQALSAELKQQYKIETEIIPADLSQENAGLQVYEQTQRKQLTIDMLINNAGFSTRGKFDSIAPEQDHQQVMVNVLSIVDLTHAFLPSMIARGGGRVINLGSTTSFYLLPYQAVYAATKAFVLSFTEALWIEYRNQGIKVLALCPGATDTEFFTTMGRDVKLKKQLPKEVVRVCLSALDRDRHFVIPGLRNQIESTLLPRFLPRALVAALVGRESQKDYL